MKWISDEAIDRLREAAELPELAGTKYRLVREVGSGGMGKVYLVEDLELGRAVAMKVLGVPDPSGDLTRRMLREAKILAGLEHPGIVPIHDAGKLADGRVFFTMKFVQGRRFDQYVREQTSLQDQLRCFQKVCEAVAMAHDRGVIHRDLKPENIMVGPFGEVLVMDWGIAKVLRGQSDDDAEGARTGALWDRNTAGAGAAAPAGGSAGESLAGGGACEARDTADGAILGTPYYMSPEQARGHVDKLDERTDVHALGAILYFILRADALTGGPPWSADPGPASAGANASAWRRVFFAARGRGGPRRDSQGRGAGGLRLAAISAKAMSPVREERYGSAKEMASDILKFLDGLPVSAYRENILEKAGRWAGRNRFIILLVVAYLLMRAVVFFLVRR